MDMYTHKVHYYETDKMGCVHHSNYIRWMEEARVELLDRLGIGFSMMEARGIISPVVGIQCRYLRPTHFDERVSVRVTVTEYKGVRLRIGYEMTDEVGNPVCTGSSEHCFTDATGKPIALKKQYPDIDAVLREAAAAE